MINRVGQAEVGRIRNCFEVFKSLGSCGHLQNREGGGICENSLLFNGFEQFFSMKIGFDINHGLFVACMIVVVKAMVIFLLIRSSGAFEHVVRTVILELDWPFEEDDRLWHVDT